MANGGGLTRRARNILIWVAVVTIGGVGILVILGGILLDPRGEPIIDKPETLIGTIITAFSALMAVLLPSILKAESNSEAVRAEVAPETPQPVPSMRVVVTEAIEVVKKEVAEVKEKVEDVETAVDATQADVRGIRRDVGRVADGLRDSARDRHQLNNRVAKIERRQDEGFRRLGDVENKEENDGPVAP